MENSKYGITYCQLSLTLNWLKNWVITDETTRDADPNGNPPVLEIRVPTSAIFETEETKLYVPVVTLSAKDYN